MQTQTTESAATSSMPVKIAVELNAVVYRAASTLAEREQCFRMVHDAYVRMGYMKPNHGGIRFNKYLTGDGTVTFGAFDGDRLVGTMTLFMDGACALPCDQIFGKEVDELRQAGRRVAEVGALASADCGRRGGLDRFLTLARMCGKYAFDNGIDDALITVNPRHRDIYPKLLKFEPFSEERTYASLENQPAICYRIRREMFPTAHWVQGVAIPDVPQWAPSFSAEDEDYFEALAAGAVLMGTA